VSLCKHIKKQKCFFIFSSIIFELNRFSFCNRRKIDGFVLPKPIRDGMNLNPGDKISIIVENDKIYIKKMSSDKK
jgi:AbrB family looped-hinge helix DNA binding protein